MTSPAAPCLALPAAASALPLVGRRARAQAANTIKIGVLNDQSGPYRDTGGITSVICCKQAVEEFAAKGFNVEVVFARPPEQARPRGVDRARNGTTAMAST